MANWQINQMMKRRQVRVFIAIGASLFVILAMAPVLFMGTHTKKANSVQKPIDITGIVEESFTEAVEDNALLKQQTELESLKKKIMELNKNLNTMQEERQKELSVQKEELLSQMTTLIEAKQEKAKTELVPGAPPQLQNPELWHAPINMPLAKGLLDAPHSIHAVSFRPKRRASNNNYLNPAHYVPSNTSVRAIILGGADADASVNSQSKNNGVMLFKFLDEGTLPNGRRSHLSGCRVSANSYGDISSERAFATLYRLSCARPGLPIIDKEVTGWIFFNGKVGIKGVPLMRDNKIMTWAGVSGALSGIAQAAQYAQSVQSIGHYGASSVIPSKQVAPYAAYGGASKAADTLSQYYVKRAEQYHPVIQVGAGNVVTVVFKDGFYLEPDEKQEQYAMHHVKRKTTQQLMPTNESNESNESNEEEATSDMNFTVPPEVLGKIDQVNTRSRNKTGEKE